MELNRTFWKNRRVLVTGHTGFKGGWLSLWLQRLGAQVTGYALAPDPNESLFVEAGVAEEMQSVFGDLRDLPALCSAVEQSRPEVVFHLAAQPLVRVSYEQPVETFAVNLMGTVHLLEALRRIGGVISAVAVTTDKVYENVERPDGYTETDRLGGHDPYAASKACAELAVASYRRSFADCPPVATARAGNVIGGGDRARDRLLPDLLQAFMTGARPLIRSPQAVRPWQHVLDPLCGYLILAQQLAETPKLYASAWNFGPDEESHVTVRCLLEKLGLFCGGAVEWDRLPGSHPHETACLRLDSTQSRRALGWHPCWTLNTALEQTVAWWKVRQAGGDLRAETLRQISFFETGIGGSCE
jgi:CDP-glucose 4,6-dehydratase